MNIIVNIEAKYTEFADLFDEYVSTFLSTEDGRKHLAAYADIRQQARLNFDTIVRAAERGEDISDAVIAQLLPHADTDANREAERWRHIAPAFSSDVRVKYEASGWTQAEDWPHVAHAIFDFVQRAIAQPEDLAIVCADFAALPYSKGFQTGTLSPILNALCPAEFALINSKPRRVINYFVGSKYSLALTDYADINATAHMLLDTVADTMHAHDLPNASDADIFDAFCHWLIAIKQYDFDAPALIDDANITTGPFSQIFASREEAGWAFDLIRETLRHLGVEHAADERFALTLADGERTLRLNFGNWAVLHFAGPCYIPFRVGMALLEESLDILGPYDQQRAFSTNDDVKICLFVLPMETAKPLQGTLRKVYEQSLDYIVEHFKDWHASNYRRFNQSDLAEAIFDVKKRDALFGDGFCGSSSVKEEKLAYTAMTSNIWWVNQGTTLAKERDGNYLWAPLKSKGGRTMYHWDMLEEVQSGDIVLHYANGALRYVSQVTMSATIAENPYSTQNTWKKEGRLVQAKYYQLTPAIALNTFAPQIQALRINQGPLNKEAAVKQGYLFRLTKQALSIIQQASPTADWPEYTKFFSPIETKLIENSPYSLDDCVTDTHLDKNTLSRWLRAIERKKQAVFYGPPGTGKTFVAEKLARHLVGGGDGFKELVQFHPAYAYEDFIQGIRPQTNADGSLSYPMIPGRFLDFCTRAAKREGTCVLIIDELNRANLARVFGELMYLLEYREQDIPLAGGGTLRIPKNVRILGTMNTADRSIALVDHALRRRFAFIQVSPNYEVLRRYHADTDFDVASLIAVLQRLNAQIADPHYALGITFFLHEDLTKHLEDVWRMEIEPYLEEYFFDQHDKVDAFRWEKLGL